MTLAETYALSCGVQIGKPFIDCEFYPLGFDDYVIIHNSTGMPSKTYDYYQDVIDEIKPVLEEKGCKIIQIGLSNDTYIEGCIDLRGKTSLRQTAFLIKNSKLVICGDTFSAHIAGAMDVPLVALYGITRIENCRPYWGSKKKQKLISVDYSNRKPTYSPNESPKRINEIKPEQIINAAYSLLSLPKSSYTTNFIGKFYPQKVVEMILNEPPIPIKNGNVNVRLDKNNSNFNPSYLFRVLMDNHCNLIIDKPFDLTPFLALRDKIIGVSYDISNGYDEQYIKTLNSQGIKVLLETNKKEELNDIRFKFFDNTVDLLSKAEKIDIKKDDLFVKTKKTILCGEKVFISMAHYEKSLDTTQYSGILDTEEFWKDKEHYYIYGKRKSRKSK